MTDETLLAQSAMLAFWSATASASGRINLAQNEGLETASACPGFMPTCLRPLLCKGTGPFRWGALSDDRENTSKTDIAIKISSPHCPAAPLAGSDAGTDRASGLCRISIGNRHKAELMFTEMVRSGELTAPAVCGRDPLDSGSDAVPDQAAAQHRFGRHMGQPAPWR